MRVARLGGVRLDSESIEAVATRIVELLGEGRSAPGPPRLVDAATVARFLGVSRATVYAKADELRAVRLGNGKRARLRFDPSRLPARGPVGKASADNPRPAPRRPTKPSHNGNTELLPIHGLPRAGGEPTAGA